MNLFDLSKVFLLFTITSLLPIAHAIKCWDCNSLINGGCGDPFNPTDFAMADCTQKHLPRFPDQDGQFCRKTTQRINSQYRIIRGCGYLNETSQGDTEEQLAKDEEAIQKGQCTRRTGTFSVMVEYCSCNGDGCNGASSLTTTTALVLLTLTASIGAFVGNRW